MKQITKSVENYWNFKHIQFSISNGKIPIFKLVNDTTRDVVIFSPTSIIDHTGNSDYVFTETTYENTDMPNGFIFINKALYWTLYVYEDIVFTINTSGLPILHTERVYVQPFVNECDCITKPIEGSIDINWGSIGGEINNQSDLIAILNSKEPALPDGSSIEYIGGDKQLHTLDKTIIGLGNVPNLDTTDAVNKAHSHNNYSLLQTITEAFTTTLKGYYDTAYTWVLTNGSNVLSHLSNVSNPHQTTLEQVRSENNQISGNIDADGNQIDNLSNPSANQQAATKLYADNAENNAKAYADSLVVSVYRAAGDWDASGNTFPTTGTGTEGAIRRGDTYNVTVSGTPSGFVFLDIGDTFYAKVATPGQTASNWAKFEANTEQATESIRGTAKIANSTDSADENSLNDIDIITPKKLWLNFWNRVLALGWTWSAKQTLSVSPRFSSVAASQYLKTDANKDLTSVSQIPAADIQQDSSYQFITTAQKNNVINAASGSQNGYLTSSDWTTFNNKISANQTITLSGDITGSGATSISTTISTNAVSDAKIMQSAGLSVLGRSSNTTGNVADITGTTNGQVLGISSNIVGFQNVIQGNLFQGIENPFVRNNIISGGGSIAYSLADLNSRLPLRYSAAAGGGQEAEVIMAGIITNDFDSFNGIYIQPEFVANI